MDSKTASLIEPASVAVPYESQTGGLTPSERIVALRFGELVVHVIVPKERVDPGKGTIQVSVFPHPDETDFLIVDLGGEAVNTTRRIKVDRSLIPQVA